MTIKMSATVWVPLLLLLGGAVYGVAAHIRTRLEERRYRKETGGSLFYHRGKVPLRSNAYRAVELKLCNNPCEAALILAGKRLLKAEAPALPLEGCKRGKCTCRYIQYDDRRFVQRRGVTLYGAPKGDTVTQGERRKLKGGRRATDKDDNKTASR
ncbi:MAG: hypothetical protein LBK55_01700 [Azoarcus sp.]|jgi:hypothetical protein|nr:hypothetical protein [Azoarcus sp.]